MASSPASSPPAAASPWRANSLFLLTAALVVTLDQVSKWLITRSLVWGQSVPEEGIFRFTYVRNTGGAFGLFQNQNAPLIVTAVIGAIALAFLYRYRGSQSWLLRLILGMQLGGAIGNLVDRVRLGYVVDFFDWGFWPVFNVADASITVSIILLIAYIVLRGDQGSLPRTVSKEGSGPG